MSDLHIRHIRRLLQERYLSHIDCSDIERAGRTPADHTRLSRATAAFALTLRAELEPEAAAKCVTDGFRDNGIDAIHYDEYDGCVYIVQSKWTEGGAGVEVGEISKLIQGVRDYLDGQFDAFNQRILDRADQLQKALDTANTRYEIILASTSVQPLSPEGARLLDGYVARVNQAGEILTWTFLGQAALHRAASKTVDARPIELEILLHEWGQVASPIRAFYGQVSVADVARWWMEHRHQLFSKNLRSFLGDSAVNAAIVETLQHQPERFWYLNNGLTILCEDIARKALGGDTRNAGVFVCRGAAIVNGAQTVGSIGRTRGEGVGTARVMVRLISLADAQTEFASDVTRATNTQNRIQPRDFAALDAEQHRLKAELAFDGVNYVYRSGEPVPTGSEGCEIEEATVALACAARELNLAVQAKGGVGKLWGDINTAPYRTLFNRGLTGERLWRCVRVLRRVESTLHAAREDGGGVLRQIAVHGNRFIARQVFRAISDGPTAEAQDVEGLTFAVLEDLEDNLDAALQGAYLGAAFKTPTHCETLERKLFANIAEGPLHPVPSEERKRRARERAIPRQLSLFDFPEDESLDASDREDSSASEEGDEE